MKVTMFLDDQLCEKIKAQTRDKTDAAMRDEIKRKLKLVEDVGPDERVIVVFGDSRRKLEAIFQTTIDSPDDLVRKTGNLSALGIGQVVRHLTPEESVAIRDQSHWYGYATIDEYLQSYFKQILDEVVYRGI